MRLHPQPIAKHGPAAERTGGIDRDYSNVERFLSNLRRQPIDEGAFAGARWPRDADQIGPAGSPEDLAHQAGTRRILVLDEGDGPGHRTRVARQHTFGERHECESKWRAMTRRWISLVPSPMVVSFTSRKNFSAG